MVPLHEHEGLGLMGGWASVERRVSAASTSRHAGCAPIALREVSAPIVDHKEAHHCLLDAECARTLQRA